MTDFSRRSAHTRTRMMLGASAVSLLMLGTAPAFAQVATDPSTQPTANPTARTIPDATDASTNPTPAPDATAQGSAAATDAATDAPASDGDIVVTGIRASLASSAKIKRNSTLIVDSVSAEDIGKLPDVSIADSLARLPGVTAQRLEGRDQRLSIRGLGPDFSTTLLNGREQVTVGDNRGVEYDQYPSEFFKNVNVYKSADASLIAAGIAGTVDLRMLRPLDQKERTLVVSARGQMNGIKSLNPDVSRYGYRASATYVDKFANDTLGIAIGVSATEAPSQNERYNAWGYTTDANGNLLLGGAKPYVQSNTLKRYGAVGTIEWEPSETFHSTFDALYSRFEENQTLRGIEFPLGFNVPATGITATDGFVTKATFSPAYTVQRNDTNRRKADNFSLGWNNQINFSDTLHLNIDASWSRAKRRDFLLENYSGTGYNGAGQRDTVTITQQGNNTFSIVPTLNYADTNLFKLTDPGGWGYNGTNAVVQAGFLNKPEFTDDLKSLRASLAGEFADAGVLKGWEVGGNYSRRQKTSAFTSYFLCPKGAGTNCTVASGTPTSAPVPSAAVLDTQVSLAYLGVPQMLTLDPLYLYANAYNEVYDNRPVSLVRDNRITENVSTGYAKLNFDGLAGGKPLKGALGVQVVHTEQASTGSISSFTAANGVIVLPASGKVSYTNILPSATMSVELLPSTFVKLGAAMTMVRPRLDQERINQELQLSAQNIGVGGGPQFSPFKIVGGNVNLRPYRSKNVDVSIEKYFDNGGYISLAGYFKSLSKYVDSGNSVAFDFTPYLSQFSAADQARILATGWQIGLAQTPSNSGRGYLVGTEATAQLPFKMFTSALDGFGIFASGSYTESQIKLGSNPTQAITLPGASTYVANGTIYFEKWGFQARGSYRYRSSFLAEVSGLSANPDYRTAKAEGILDAQIGYEFQDGPLRGLAILAQGKNLTDRPFVTYQNNDIRQVIDYQRYGRDYYIGVTYKF